MFTFFRKKAKYFIIIIAAVFIGGIAIGQFSSLSRQKQMNVGEINGEEITYQDFYQALDNNLQNYRNQFPDKELDDNTRKRFIDQTWEQMIQRILFDEEIKDRDIEITDEMIIDELENNPLPMFKSSERFQTDGKFDKSKYEDFLASSNPQEIEILNSIEQHLRSSLPYEKLIDQINEEVNVTEKEVKKDYIKENSKVSAEIVFFNYKKQKVEIKDEDIKAYYEDNKEEEFKEEPLRKLKYVDIALEPSPSDEKKILDKMEEIRNQIIENGRDFAKMAAEYSEGPSASKGGDLGFFTKNRMVKPFAEKAFAMEIGEVSEPVKTRFGYHLIKVFDTKTNDKGEKEVKASHILMKVAASEETKLAYQDKVNQIYSELETGNWDEVVEKYKLDSKETRGFKETASFIPGLGRNQQLVEFAFNNKVGTLHEPIDKSRGEGKTIAKVSFEIGNHIKEFKTVERQIKTDLKKEAQLEKAYAAAKEFVNKYDESEYLAKAKEAGAEIVEIENHKEGTFIKNIGREEDFSKAMFAVKTGEFTDLFEGEKGAFTAKITNKIEADMEKYAQQKDSLIEKYRTKKENEYFQEWYTSLKEEAEIEDNRDKFFN